MKKNITSVILGLLAFGATSVLAATAFDEKLSIGNFGIVVLAIIFIEDISDIIKTGRTRNLESLR